MKVYVIYCVVIPDGECTEPSEVFKEKEKAEGRATYLNKMYGGRRYKFLTKELEVQ